MVGVAEKGHQIASGNPGRQFGGSAPDSGGLVGRRAGDSVGVESPEAVQRTESSRANRGIGVIDVGRDDVVLPTVTGDHDESSDVVVLVAHGSQSRSTKLVTSVDTARANTIASRIPPINEITPRPKASSVRRAQRSPVDTGGESTEVPVSS